MRIPSGENPTAPSIPAAAAPAPAPASTPASGRKTLIVHEGLPVQDRETLQLVIQSILRLERWSPTEERLLQSLLESRQSFRSHDEVAVALTGLVEERMKDSTFVDKGLQMLIRLSEHQLLTARNRVAFTPSTKENPDSVYWPDPTHPKHPRSLHGEKIFGRRHPFIDRSVPIGSAGSCFAMRIAQMLQRQGFNYVITEPNLDSAKEFHMSCARWGIIFNVPSFRQLVERAFGLRKLPPLLWINEVKGRRTLWDPFREDVYFDTVEEFEKDVEIHTAAAREAFLRSKVFVMTLGMNEVWYLKSGKEALARAPWGMAASLVEPRILTVEENVYELQRMLDIWRAHNPDVKIIVTTSPVPLHATFRGGDHHVVAANAHSKSTLRLAAEAFAERNRDVHYFPAYETVLYGTKNPWEPDQRHVSMEAVKNVMTLFGEMFLAEKDWSPVPV